MVPCLRATCDLEPLQMLLELEPCLQEALETVEELRGQEKKEAAELEDLIFAFREAKSSREGRLADATERADSVPRSPGPLQMTGARAPM